MSRTSRRPRILRKDSQAITNRLLPDSHSPKMKRGWGVHLVLEIRGALIPFASCNSALAPV
jgi:hypothetical protein